MPTPEEAVGIATAAISGGVLGGYTGTSQNVVGQIRGLPDKLAKIVRKAMINEVKARGPSPFNPQITGGYIEEAPQALKEADVTSRLLRGTWYRGQAEYPSQAKLESVVDPASGKEVQEYITKQFGKEYGTEAPTFAGLRTKLSNLGEPHGISLSHDPSVSAGFGAPSTIEHPDYNLLEKITNTMYPSTADKFGGEQKFTDTLIKRAADLAQTNKVARVMPLYGEAPEGRILFPWKEEHGAIFRQAYVDTAKEMAEKYPGFRDAIESLPSGAKGAHLADRIEYPLNATKVLSGESYNTNYKSTRDEFNSIMSDKLRDQGWKGMLHHPNRGGMAEYELRMFDPYEVMYIDKRAVTPEAYQSNPMASKAVKRQQDMKSALREEHKNVTEGKTRSLKDWYKDITREEILGQTQSTKVVASQTKGSIDDILKQAGFNPDKMNTTEKDYAINMIKYHGSIPEE